MKKSTLFLLIALAPTMAMAQTTLSPYQITIQPGPYQPTILPVQAPAVQTVAPVVPTTSPTPNSFFDIFTEVSAPTPVVPTPVAPTSPVLNPAPAVQTAPVNWNRNFTVQACVNPSVDQLNSIDSFFDVWVEMGRPRDPGTLFLACSRLSPEKQIRVSSFFDIFTEIPMSIGCPKVPSGTMNRMSSFFDVWMGMGKPDNQTSFANACASLGQTQRSTISSFFDIFTEVTYSAGRGPATRTGGVATSSTSTPPRGPGNKREVGGGGSATSSTSTPPRPGREIGNRVNSFFDIFTEVSINSVRPPQTPVTPKVNSFFDIFTEMSVDSVFGKCMPELVKARDAAVLVAQQAYFSKVNDAFIARSEATQKAWALTSSAQRQQALKTAGTNYALAKAQAVIQYRTEKNKIWQKYYNSRKSCLSDNPRVLLEDGSQASIDDDP